MKSIVESILDNDTIDKATNVASKKFSDNYYLYTMYIETSDFTDVICPNYIRWKEFQKEIQHNIKYNGWKYDREFTTHTQGKTEIKTAFINQPLLSFDLNFLSFIKRFAKGEVHYEHEKIANRNIYDSRITFTNLSLLVFNVRR